MSRSLPFFGVNMDFPQNGGIIFASFLRRKKYERNKIMQALPNGDSEES